MRTFIRRRSRRVVAAAMLTAAPSIAMANTTYTWSGGNSGAGYFDVASNWTTTNPPTNGTSDLLFGSVNTHGNQPYTEFNYNVSSISFNSSAVAYTFGTSNNSTLNISSGGITDSAVNNPEAISIPLALDTNQTWNVYNNTFSALSTLNLGTSVLTVNTAASTVANFTGTLSGTSTASIYKSGAGLLTLTGGGTIPTLSAQGGTTNVSAGTLTLSGTGQSVSVNVGTLTVNAGAVLNASTGTADIDGVAVPPSSPHRTSRRHSPRRGRCIG